MFKLTVEESIRKSHKDIMGGRDTYHLAGVLMIGKTEVVEDIPTARTNGQDKLYGREFMGTLTQEEVVGVVMHEAVHILLRHISRHRDLIKEDKELANAAMDYVDNAYIKSLDGYGEWFKLPQPYLWDDKFDNWTVRQVYNFLKQGRDAGKPDLTPSKPIAGKTMDGRSKVTIYGRDYVTESTDEHDASVVEGMSTEQLQELEKKISQAIQEASLLAGVAGKDTPRAFGELLAPERNWREDLQEFASSAVRGNDQATFRRFNRQRLADDLYRPSKYNDRIGNIIVANDTSGSIGDEAMSIWLDALADICEQCVPDSVRVLWWDSEVRGDQELTGSYGNLREVLKPSGGGGTHVSSVAKYINKEQLKADCVIVFTDGYTEHEITWDINVPTLWVVTEREDFTPPVGQVIKFRKEV
jgi:predicted metal-dependent peptidase